MTSGLPTVEEWLRLQEVLVPFLVRCGAAALCGGMIGLERELRKKPAGFRTNILICVGAAMYMTIGLLIFEDDTRMGDPTRIAAQVVTGIGFLGAGAIIQSHGRVSGLTSAATIWVVAAIGIIAGAGYPILAFVAACMVVLTLVLLLKVEARFLDPAAGDDAKGGDV
jgi:putative Mg2+ transporter-C (MgtC) family protein